MRRDNQGATAQPTKTQIPEKSRQRQSTATLKNEKNGFLKKKNTLAPWLITLLFLTLFSNAVLKAQAQTYPAAYVSEAIATSHSLRQQELLLEKSLLALEEARKLYWPELGFGATYTLAAGGRSIFIPVGDLVNPVYATLNQLLMSNAFPQIENEKEQFLPNNFYDARFRIRQPLLQREIYFNRRIKETAISLREAEIRAFRRELTRDVKIAYYRYLQSGEAVRIYDNALALLAENQRVNESLLRNDKIIPSVLTRLAAEMAAVEARRLEALNNRKNAAAYLNFLLNRSPETPIETDSSHWKELPATMEVFTAPGRKEELEQLQAARQMNALATEMKEAWRVPKVGLQLDLGSQNFDFDWGGYVLAGLSVEVPLWTAGRNELQTEQSRLEGRALAEQEKQLTAALALQEFTARNNLMTALETWRSFEGRLDSARRHYRDTSLRYKEGMANYLELLDARSQLTDTELQQSLAQFQTLISKAEWERAAGL
jgi:outer membrane protein TolC